MQYDLTNARLWFRDTLPSTRPSSFYSLRDLMVLDNGDTFVWNNAWVKVTNPILTPPGGTGTPGTPGQDGKDATVTIGTVTVNTLAAGSPATVQVTDSNPDPNVATLNFNFGIPQGQKGDTGATGAPGSGGSGTVVGSPGRIYVTPNGSDDTANLQAALLEQKTTGKKIELAGTYKLSSGLTIAPDHLYTNIEGWAKLQAINQTPFTFFSSPVPTDTVQAEGQYTQRKIKMSNLILQGWGKLQTGIDLFAWEGAKFEQIWGGEMKRFMDVTFGLRTIIEECEANGCTDGFIVRSGQGRWSNATTSNSCSNGTTLSHCRVYCAGTNIGIGVYDASGCVIDYPVVEGGSVNRGIDYASMSPTSTGLKLYRYHFECNGTVSDAQVVIRSSTMTHVLDAPQFGVNGACVRVEGGGYPQIVIRDISSGRFPAAPGRFKHMAGASWQFENCDDPLRSFASVITNFDQGGVTMREACGFNAGANAICVKPVSR